LILAFADPLHGRPVRSFEIIIAILVSTSNVYTPSLDISQQVLIVLVCLCILVSRIHVQWEEAFQGFLPSKTLIHHGGLYTCAKISFFVTWMS
jgi:metal iron transporter